MPEPGEGDRGATGPPIFGSSVNPISTGEGGLSPPINTGNPNVFHLLASLKGIITLLLLFSGEVKLKDLKFVSNFFHSLFFKKTKNCRYE
jgi:hypothetical protein